MAPAQEDVGEAVGLLWSSGNVIRHLEQVARLFSFPGNWCRWGGYHRFQRNITDPTTEGAESTVHWKAYRRAEAPRFSSSVTSSTAISNSIVTTSNIFHIFNHLILLQTSTCLNQETTSSRQLEGECPGKYNWQPTGGPSPLRVSDCDFVSREESAAVSST